MIFKAEDWPSFWAFQTVAQFPLRGELRPCVIFTVTATPGQPPSAIELWFLGVEKTVTYTAPDSIEAIRRAFALAAGRWVPDAR